MGLTLLVVLLALSYIRISDLMPSLAPYRIIFVLGALGMLVTVVGLPFRRGIKIQGRQLMLLVGLTLCIALSWITRGWVGGAIDSLIDFSSSLFLFVLVYLHAQSLSRLKVLSFILTASILVLAVGGIAAYHYGFLEEELILGENYSEPSESYSDTVVIKRVRAIGFLHDPNDLAQVLACVLPLIGLAWVRGHTLRNLLLVVIPGCIVLYALILTRSRGGLVSIAVLLSLLVLIRFGKVPASLLGGVMLVVLLAVGSLGGRSVSADDESARGRLDAWGAGIEMLRESPIFGVGYSQFADRNGLTAHNSFVLCFAELGMAGYFFWLALLVTTYLDLQRVRNACANDVARSRLYSWATALMLSLSAFLVGAFFLSRTYTITLYVLLALATGCVSVALRTHDDIRPMRLNGWAPLVLLICFLSVLFVHAAVKVRFI